jgi:hypothetical protein
MTEAKQNQCTIVVRNQSIETRHPGGVAAFAETYSPAGNEVAWVVGSLGQEGADR